MKAKEALETIISTQKGAISFLHGFEDAVSGQGDVDSVYQNDSDPDFAYYIGAFAGIKLGDKTTYRYDVVTIGPYNSKSTTFGVVCTEIHEGDSDYKIVGVDIPWLTHANAFKARDAYIAGKLKWADDDRTKTNYVYGP